ncbi:MAG TPA: HU family DNA-binding protein [Candidatus Bacteroides merdavium]|uniref:HU family DNA-binding protein n=1 Tax=Candidatus Bacteroides merdavium TaxID=2838472 RepID=A0A9D2GXH4_9BACE|nr:HU family DNA-binding protein [uncultured Bacteroides sp.]HIZ91006.1 HU family DNA-binding protein [Candidatus Bacteroides merdavium]
MNKAELINAMAGNADMTKADAAKALNAFLEVVTDALKRGEKVTLVGFGTFSVTERAARMGINPTNKQPIEIPAKKAVKFKAGTELSFE